MQIFVSAYIIPQRCPNFHEQDKHKLIQKKSSWSNYVRHLTNLCQLVGPKFPKTSDKSHASTIFETFFFSYSERALVELSVLWITILSVYFEQIWSVTRGLLICILKPNPLNVFCPIKYSKFKFILSITNKMFPAKLCYCMLPRWN